MKINTALILCAGFGKRLNPITLNTPKPLLKLNDLTLLDQCIKLILDLGVKKIFINTFYLKDKFYEFFKNHNYNIDIEVIEDGGAILDTGGGILNLINQSKDENFLVFNPDTIWSKKYIEESLTQAIQGSEQKIDEMFDNSSKALSEIVSEAKSKPNNIR